MPVVRFHLPEDKYSQQQCEELLTQASELYASVLESPVERVRVYIQFYRPWAMACGGKAVSAGGNVAPLFECVVLAGRPESQRHALLRGFTDLIVNVLDEPENMVRGACWPVEPENWAIAGSPASAIRQAEIKAREEAAGAK